MSPLKLAVLSMSIAVVLSSYLAWYVDLFSSEVHFTKWIQNFTMGEVSFLNGLIFWMGLRGVAGITMILVFSTLWLRRRRIEAIFLSLISIPDIFNIWLREFIGRPRPNEDMVNVLTGYGGAQGSSFPSGHALHVILFYGFLAYLASKYISNRHFVVATWALVILYTLISGLWLIYDGRHWFLDVLGGYIYGLFYLLVLISCYKWTKERILLDERLQSPLLLRKSVTYLLRLIR